MLHAVLAISLFGILNLVYSITPRNVEQSTYNIPSFVENQTFGDTNNDKPKSKGGKAKSPTDDGSDYSKSFDALMVELQANNDDTAAYYKFENLLLSSNGFSLAPTAKRSDFDVKALLEEGVFKYSLTVNSSEVSVKINQDSKSDEPVVEFINDSPQINKMLFNPQNRFAEIVNDTMELCLKNQACSATSVDDLHKFIYTYLCSLFGYKSLVYRFPAALVAYMLVHPNIGENSGVDGVLVSKSLSDSGIDTQRIYYREDVKSKLDKKSYVLLGLLASSLYHREHIFDYLSTVGNSRFHSKDGAFGLSYVDLEKSIGSKLTQHYGDFHQEVLGHLHDTSISLNRSFFPSGTGASTFFQLEDKRTSESGFDNKWMSKVLSYILFEKCSEDYIPGEPFYRRCKDSTPVKFLLPHVQKYTTADKRELKLYGLYPTRIMCDKKKENNVKLDVGDKTLEKKFIYDKVFKVLQLLKSDITLAYEDARGAVQVVPIADELLPVLTTYITSLLYYSKFGIRYRINKIKKSDIYKEVVPDANEFYKSKNSGYNFVNSKMDEL